MKFDFTKAKIITLDDVEIGSMNNVVSDMLGNTQSSYDPQKLLAMARKVRKGPIDIDAADLKMIETVIRDFKTPEGIGVGAPFVKGQILDEIDEQRVADRVPAEKAKTH